MGQRLDRRALLLGALGAGGAVVLGRATRGSGPSGQAPTTGRAAQSASGGEIDRTWIRIETWLQANAPEGLGVLRPGASEEALAAAEKSLDLQFPEALRQSLARHDGQKWQWPSLIEFGILMPLREIVVYTRQNEQHGVDEATGDQAWWRKGWLPFVSRDGDHLSVALGASGDGEVWAFQHDMEPIHSVVAPNFETWLARWADELEAGVFELDRAAGAGLLPRDGKTSRLWPQ